MFEADQQDFAGIGHRATTDRDNQVSTHRARVIRSLENIAARGVGLDTIMCRCVAFAECCLDPADLVSLLIEMRTGQDENLAGAPIGRLFGNSLCRRHAKCDTFGGRQNDL